MLSKWTWGVRRRKGRGREGDGGAGEEVISVAAAQEKLVDPLLEKLCVCFFCLFLFFNLLTSIFIFKK